MFHNRYRNIFAIDDNAGHISLIKKFIEINTGFDEEARTDERIRLYCLRTIDDYKNFLLRKKLYKNLPKPDGLYLGMLYGGVLSGWDVLEFIHNNKALRELKIVVLSGAPDYKSEVCMRYPQVLGFSCNTADDRCPNITDGIEFLINRLFRQEDGE